MASILYKGKTEGVVDCSGVVPTWEGFDPSAYMFNFGGLLPVFWYDLADQATLTIIDGKISQINDKSTNNRNATQPNASFRPYYSEPLATTVFAENHFMSFPSATVTDFTVFIVTSGATTNLNPVISTSSGFAPTIIHARYNSGNGFEVGYRDPVGTAFYLRQADFGAINGSVEVIALRKQGTILRAIRPGGGIVEMPVSTTPATFNWLFRRGVAPRTFDGHTGEVIMYDFAFTDENLLLAYQSLDLKWSAN